MLLIYGFEAQAMIKTSMTVLNTFTLLPRTRLLELVLGRQVLMSGLLMMLARQ